MRSFTRIPNDITSQPWFTSPTTTYLYTWLSLNADDNGQITTSRADLSERTGLTEQQIRTALGKLEATKYVTKLSTKLPTKFATTLTVSYLGNYKPQKTKSGQVNDQAANQVNDQPRAYKNDNIIISCLKEDKEDKENIIKEKKETPTIVGAKKETKVSDAAEAATLSKVKGIEERQRDFYETMRPYVGKYPKEMLRAFYDYWSEPNRSRTKMRVELEKTWSLPLRLATWNKRDKERQFNGNNSRDNTAKQRADDAAGIVARLLSQNKPAGQ